MNKNQGNLCSYCKYRFRRVFIPRSDEYEDAEGNVVVANEDDIIISNQCLIIEMDIDREATVECSHFEPIDKKEIEDFPFFKHLK